MKSGMEPWRGKNYKPGGLLVLGESAYNKENPANPVDPGTCIRDVICGLRPEGKAKRWHLHFKRIFLTVRGPEAERDWQAETAKAFFDGIAYANYVIESVGGDAKSRPIPGQWQDAGEPFRALLNKIKPGRVLVLGFGAWGSILKNFRVPPGEEEIFQLPVDNAPSALVCVIPHPSSRNRIKFNAARVHGHFCHKFPQADA